MRDREDPETAEAAAAVVDAYQGRGLGSILLEVLAETAQENGMKRFYGIISSENRVVRDAVRRAGASSVWEDGVFRFELPLPLAAEELRDSKVYVALRAAARGELEV